MSVRSLALVPVLLLAALSAPASATPGPGEAGFQPELRTERTFFHCSSANKVGGVDTATGDVATWDTKAPSTSFTAGGGCGQYDNVLSGGTGVFSATWRGTFTGNLDSLTVELHRLVGGAGRSVTAPMIVAILNVDGEEIYNGDVEGLAYTPSATGASESTSFSFAGLDYRTEHGPGAESRAVSLTIDSYNEAQNVWAYDAAEVPAGVTFNPAKTAPVTLKR